MVRGKEVRNIAVSPVCHLRRTSPRTTVGNTVPVVRDSQVQAWDPTSLAQCLNFPYPMTRGRSLYYHFY